LNLSGGISKEFFQLIINQIVDPVHGLFVVEEDTMLSWFNSNSQDIEEFFLIGTVKLKEEKEEREERRRGKRGIIGRSIVVY
jgi:hypothetical protein